MLIYGYIIAITNILGLYLVSGSIQQSFFFVHNGYEMSSFYEERHLPSLVRCASYCNVSAQCVAATFDVSLKRCLLSDQLINAVNSTTNLNKRIIILNGNTSSSVCAVPLTVQNGEVVVTQTMTGATAELSCNIYHKPVSALTNFYCTHLTGWENKTGMQCLPITAVTMGTSFVLSFIRGSEVGIPQLLIANEQTATIRIEMPYSGIDATFTTSNHSGLTYQFDEFSTVSTARLFEQKAAFVTSDVPIQLHINIFNDLSSDGSAVLPTHCLGNEYFVAGYPDPDDMDMVLITGVYDGTVISVVYTSNTMETITLNANATYMIKGYDLTGTRVSSSSPFNLQSANGRAGVPNGNVYYYDLLEETMPPVSSLGTTHIISYMYPRPDFTIGIVVTQSLTDITIYDKNSAVIEVITNQGQSLALFRTYNGSQTISVISSKPIMIHQYGHGSNRELGDPSMMFIPDVGVYGHHYNFVIPTGTPNWVLTVIMSDTLLTSMLKLNGQSLNIAHTIPVTLHDNNMYTVMYMDITAGTYLLTHDYGDSTIYGVWVYGRSNSTEISYVLGYNVTC